ncbi:MAG: hybrid sensor histidine kinase/response regulator, partial [Candidatus Xenobia bacterium]
VLIADDEDSIRLVLRKTLEGHYETREAANGDSAVALLEPFRPDLVVVDLHMPGCSGLQVLSEAHRIDPMLPVVIITGHATVDTAVEALRLGAYDYLQKPLDDLEAVRTTLSRALEVRRLRLENQQLVDNLHHAHNFRARLMNAVAHDLKGMLTGILSYTQMARMLVRSEGHRELTAIHRVAGRMKLLADDLITYGALEARAMRLHMERVPLGRLLREALEPLSEDAERVRIPETLPEVYADPHWTVQILNNLLDNALRYSAARTLVTVQVEVKGPVVEVAVQDEGPGIDAAAIATMFEPFQRSEHGSGLGLAIVKDLVAMQGGKVWAERPPRGARFCFTLRLEPMNGKA